MRALLGVLAGLTALAVLAACSSPVSSSSAPALPSPGALAASGVASLTVRVLGTSPHDTSAFTEGFELSPDARTLWEGTGEQGASQLRETDPATGAVRRAVDLPASQFGEGVTVLPDRIWQLTWKDGVVYERDPVTLAVRGILPYDREGWGMCHTPGAAPEVVTSDGTSTIVVRDPATFAPRRSVDVTLAGRPVTQLNELDCSDGRTVWANVWQTDRIVGIDLATGRVTAVVDAAALRPASTTGDRDAVLNGIAAVPGTVRASGARGDGPEFLLAGKRWPTTFRVRFVPA